VEKKNLMLMDEPKVKYDKKNKKDKDYSKDGDTVETVDLPKDGKLSDFLF
jgi:hypothetical protein